MSKVVYISDFFASQVLGGGELNDEELLYLLESAGHNIYKYNSSSITEKILEKHKSDFFIVSNFVQLSWEYREWLTYNAAYVVYEHDHKYLVTRNPSVYQDFKAPARDLRNYFFYKSARKIICQSDFHRNIIHKNLGLKNIVSVGGNLWSEETLKKLSEFSKKEKQPTTAILDSRTPHKNTHKTTLYCKKKGIEYRLVGDKSYLSFLDKLSINQKFVFLPATPETLSRVVCEARMMGMSVATNNLVGATQEPWFKLKGENLIVHMRKKKKQILEVFIKEISKIKEDKHRPKVSIVTTFHDGEIFLDGFLKNIVGQTIFKQCELIIIDAASTGAEKNLIEEYQSKHSNIVHVRLKEKLKPTPSLNLAIQKSKGKYIHMSLIDDRKHKRSVEYLSDELDKNSTVGLVYGDVFVSTTPNETYKQNNKKKKSEHSSFEFSRENMIKCLPGPMPMWRSELHESLGFFDDLECNYADDWEMWLRMIQQGVKFKKIKHPVGLYLTGGRSQKENNMEQRQEEARIFFKYADVFGYNYHKYRDYFSQFVR